MKEKAVSTDCDDFITDEPEPIRFFNAEKWKVLMEHKHIIKALTGKNLTAKDIHALYWNHDKQEYTKTIKTVYRYLELLKKDGFVKVAGHRKPKDGRLTEKLYCRTAKVFYHEDPASIPDWWEKEEGKTLMQLLGDLVWEFFQITNTDTSTFQKLMLQYLEVRNQTMNELYSKTRDNKKLAEIFGKVEFHDIKLLASFVGMLGVFLQEPDVIAQLQTLLKERTESD